jgi:predicted anti-sigma-YlaC factor YlaD
MNCRDIEPLLLSERDGVLTSEQHAALEQHVASCPACRQLRARLAETLNAYQADAAQVTVPDVDEEWRAVRARWHEAKSAKKRPLAPVIWFGSSLAAAAALIFALVGNRPKPAAPEVFSPDNEVVAEAEFVEAGDITASTMVYVDKESGWLVVWTTNGDANGKG